MNNRLVNAMKSFVNKDTSTMLINNIVSLIRGPIIMLLIPLFLSESTQGYWYTISSLSALSTFADLGFGTLVGQFSAHEFANLQFDKKMNYIGEQERISKMASLFKYVIKWSMCVCAIAYPIIMGIGIGVLNTHGNMSEWLLPWIIYMLSGGFSFIVRIMLSFFEGCNLISKIQTNYMIANIINAAVTIGMLAGKCGLYALVIPSIISIIINGGLMVFVLGRPIKQLFKTKCKVNHHWGKNFLSLIWKYAISWASGYFIFQIYTPLAFVVYDPVAAGKIGITMTLVQACFTIANTFNVVFIPKMNMAVANREWGRAEGFVKKGLFMSMPLYMIGAAIILLGLGFGQGHISLLDRFLEPSTTAFLLVAWFFQIPINVIATYGRAHKQEPFMVMSIISSLAILATTVLIMYTLPINYYFMGFAVSNVLSTFIFIYMYFKSKNTWHERLIAKQEANAKILLEESKSMPNNEENL